MLREVFYWVLNISIAGSVTGLIVLVLRKIGKLPRFSVYLLWAIPLIRLWMPFGIANPYSLLSVLSKFTTRTVAIAGSAPELTATNFIMGANSYFPIEYKSDALERFFGIACAVWVVLAAAAVLTAFVLYYFTKLELRDAAWLKDNIYTSDKITAPAVYGFIRPKIIIPEGAAERDIDYIVMHERVHIRRKDNLLRVIAIITACVHWFNPLVWVFLKCFFSDMELACDSKVLKGLNEERAGEYAAAILSCATGKTLFASAFGGAKTKVRIENILSFEKLTAASSLFFALLMIGITLVLITNAAV